MKKILFILFIISELSFAQSVIIRARNKDTNTVSIDTQFPILKSNRDGSLIVHIDSSISTSGSGNPTSTSFALMDITNSAVQLDSYVCKYVSITYKASGVDTLWVWHTSSVGGTYGIVLFSGDVIRMACTNANQFWIKGSSLTTKVNGVLLWYEN
jgi:hypothetical protein